MIDSQCSPSLYWSQLKMHPKRVQYAIIQNSSFTYLDCGVTTQCVAVTPYITLLWIFG